MTQLQPDERARKIQMMFGKIAGRYDLMNRLMTFGQDRHWRQFVVDVAAPPPQGKLLDIAVGTGDIALAARRKYPELFVVGGDFSLPMMRVGKKRPDGTVIAWCQTDALALPFPDNEFDAVVSGYLLRNLVDLRQGLVEQWRVLRPGGVMVALDTTPPPRSLLRPLIQFQLKYGIPFLGRVIAGEPEAYQYLPSSTQTFKTPQELAALMEDAGFVSITCRTFMFGTMAVHWGRKPA